MDEFLNDIHTSIYKQWILNQKINDCNISLTNEKFDTIYLKTSFGLGRITFYDLNIIELNVTNIHEEPKFYLHFQMNNIHHALELFTEMKECLLSLKDDVKTKILLCCSGGLTTSYFASKMKEVNDLLELNYEINAIGYNRLFEVGDDYDVIMLAPQVSYMLSKVERIYNNKILLKIPPRIFAKYDVKGIFELIEKQKTSKVKTTSKQILRQEKYLVDKKLLCLSLYRNKSQVHISYRLYYHNEIIINNEVIKNKISMQDLYDVIDTVILNCPDLNVVAFSAPGIINDGKATAANINGFDAMDYKGLFSNRYSQRFIITNDVNTAAIGFNSLNDYSSCCFIFQPILVYAGIGIIINNQLIEGKQNIAGEVQYLPACKEYMKNNKANTPEKMEELVKRIILSIISIIGPQAVALYCTLIPDINEIIEKIKEEIPTRYIPEIIKVDNIQDYIFIGQTIICQEYL